MQDIFDNIKHGQKLCIFTYSRTYIGELVGKSEDVVIFKLTDREMMPDSKQAVVNINRCDIEAVGYEVDNNDV